MLMTPLIERTATNRGVRELRLHIREGWITQENPDVLVWPRRKYLEMPNDAVAATVVIFGEQKEAILLPGHYRHQRRWQKPPTSVELDILKDLAVQEIIIVENTADTSRKERDKNTRLIHMLDRKRSAIHKLAPYLSVTRNPV